jgi:hypothetical protein
MNQFWKSHNPTIKMYDPTNHEMWLGDEISKEHINVYSPPILWWKMSETTFLNSDELDKLYGESQSIIYQNVDNPIEVIGYIESSPIMEELGRMGLSEVKDFNFLTNISDIVERLQEEPKPGDLFAIGNLIRQNKMDYTFYMVASVIESDFHLWRYVHYLINAKQTNLSNVPEKIKNYFKNK